MELGVRGSCTVGIEAGIGACVGVEMELGVGASGVVPLGMGVGEGSVQATSRSALEANRNWNRKATPMAQL